MSVTHPHPTWRGRGRLDVNGVSLYVDVVGEGPPLVLMHGGPSADHWTLLPLRDLADRFTLVFYDHRCNGRSEGAPVESMTWVNLTADAEALRERLGFERWSVLGHSFGGAVALEYALRYPESVSRLVLMNTGADAHWQRENAARVVAERGATPEQVDMVRRWFHGEFAPDEYWHILRTIGPLYMHDASVWRLLMVMARGEWRAKTRPEALIQSGRVLYKDWSVLERLGEIKAPTLVIAGRSDFVFPPECQEQLAAGIPGARLHLVDKAGHSPDSEQKEETLRVIADFLASTA